MVVLVIWVSPVDPLPVLYDIYCDLYRLGMQLGQSALAMCDKLEPTFSANE